MTNIVLYVIFSCLSSLVHTLVQVLRRECLRVLSALMKVCIQPCSAWCIVTLIKALPNDLDGVRMVCI